MVLSRDGTDFPHSHEEKDHTGKLRNIRARNQACKGHCGQTEVALVCSPLAEFQLFLVHAMREISLYY